MILLPHTAGEWSTSRRRAVLDHELAHIARGDAQGRWLAAALCTIYWFHPLAWLAARRLHAESESACDDRLLGSGMEATEYADHLLAVARVAQRGGGGSSLFLAARMASQPEISRRIHAVLDATRRRQAVGVRPRGALFVSGTLLLLAVSGGEIVRRGEAHEVRPASITTQGAVRTVTHQPSAFASARQLEVEATPVTSIEGGELGSADDMRWVTDVTLLSDGRIAAFRRIGPVVFIFDRSGRIERRIGKLGREPGDFMAPTGMTLLGADTLYVLDEGNARANWITPEGGFVRTAPVTSPRIHGAIPRGRLRSGRIVLLSSLVQDEASSNVSRPPTALALTNTTLTATNEVARVAGFEMADIMTNYRGRPRPQRIVLRLGRGANAVAWDTVIAVGTGANGYEIEQRNEAGAVVGRIRVEQPRRPVTQRMRDARIAMELAQIDGPQSERYVDKEETIRQARENPFADSLPPHSMLYATRTGTLWVLDAFAPGDSLWTATAFRPDGAISARLRAPMGDFPLYFSDDRVILRSADAKGRVTLRVHRIVPARN